MFEYGRSAIDFDRGSSLEEDHAAIGHRELARAEEPPYLPLGTIEQCLRFPALYSYEPTREEKIAASKSYLKQLKYVLPADRSFGFSHLWHEALHAGNTTYYACKCPYIPCDNCPILEQEIIRSKTIICVTEQAFQGLSVRTYALRHSCRAIVYCCDLM
ncbi:hypothetical protein E4U59_007881 [Claviceps monticola]|nr:hypothetical protein E4U59_007881 [Claviceps monticola]